MSDIVHVAVAVIVNKNNEVCISLRHKDSHQGGLWEFPGGKIERGETSENALIREIKEELNLEIEQSHCMITITHDYHDKRVCLHVHRVRSYHGLVTGVEGQQIKWVDITALLDHDFPAANLPIIKALQLPDRYLITGKFVDNDDFINKLEKALEKNIKLVQLRLKDSDLKDKDLSRSLIEKTATLCRQSGAKLMLNLSSGFTDIVDLSQLDFDGFHADSRTLNLLSTGELRLPLSGKLLSASCHNDKELSQAVELQADFVVLSPVQKTASHPDMQAMGWQAFTAMIKDVPMPVYALGGVSEEDIETAWLHGAQGVAAISAFWK